MVAAHRQYALFLPWHSPQSVRRAAVAQSSTAGEHLLRRGIGASPQRSGRPLMVVRRRNTRSSSPVRHEGEDPLRKSPLLERLATAGILRAAIDVFSRHGFAATRVEDILEAANVARRTFYKHFSSKE